MRTMVAAGLLLSVADHKANHDDVCDLRVETLARKFHRRARRLLSARRVGRPAVPEPDCHDFLLGSVIIAESEPRIEHV
jgi:hypothetical protein